MRKKIKEPISRTIKKIIIFIVLLGGFYGLINLAWLGPWTLEPDYWKPHLNYGDTLTTIYVTTRTPSACKLQVVWDVDTGSTWVSQPAVVDNKETFIHELPLTNLLPNQSIRYHLEVLSGYETKVSDSIQQDLQRSFIIPGNVIREENQNSSIKFGVYGDNRPTIFGTTIHNYITDAILSKNPDFVLQDGDLVQTGGSNVEWAQFFTTGESLFRRIPLMPAPGNHEYYTGMALNQDTGENATNYLDAFHLPGAESYYAYNVSKTHFISLDISGGDGAKNPQIQAAQMVWLDTHLNTLNKSRSQFDWLIVFFHYPIESTGESHENIWDEILGPVFNKYNITIDILFVGHIHQYERLYLQRARTWCVITAGGGAEIEQWNGGPLNPGTACLELSHSYVITEINVLTLNMKAYFLKGAQFDNLILSKTEGGL